MNSTGTTALDSTVVHAGTRSAALCELQDMAAADIARTIQFLSSTLEARKAASRQMIHSTSRDLHRHSSYVAHVERFARPA